MFLRRAVYHPHKFSLSQNVWLAGKARKGGGSAPKKGGRGAAKRNQKAETIRTEHERDVDDLKTIQSTLKTKILSLNPDASINTTKDMKKQAALLDEIINLFVQAKEKYDKIIERATTIGYEGYEDIQKQADAIFGDLDDAGDENLTTITHLLKPFLNQLEEMLGLIEAEIDRIEGKTVLSEAQQYHSDKKLITFLKHADKIYNIIETLKKDFRSPDVVAQKKKAKISKQRIHAKVSDAVAREDKRNKQEIEEKMEKEKKKLEKERRQQEENKRKREQDARKKIQENKIPDNPEQYSKDQKHKIDVNDLLKSKTQLTSAEEEFDKQESKEEKEDKLASYYKMCVEFANWAKHKVYPTIQRYLEVSCLQKALERVTYSAVMLSEHRGKLTTLKNASHQIVRSFLHLHDEHIQPVIYAYLQLINGKILPAQAFNVLVQAITDEVNINLANSEFYDIALLKFLLEDLNPAENTKNDYEASAQPLLYGLHMGLRALHFNIIYLEWTADWKNMIKMIEYERGPWQILLTESKSEDGGFEIPAIMLEKIDPDAWMKTIQEIDDVDSQLQSTTRKKSRYNVLLQNRQKITSLKMLFEYVLNRTLIGYEKHKMSILRDQNGKIVKQKNAGEDQELKEHVMRTKKIIMWYEVLDNIEDETPEDLQMISTNQLNMLEFNPNIDLTVLRWIFDKTRTYWAQYETRRDTLDLAKEVFTKVPLKEIIDQFQQYFQNDFEPTKIENSVVKMQFASILNTQDYDFFSNLHETRHVMLFQLIKEKWCAELNIVNYFSFKRLLVTESTNSKVSEQLITYQQKCIYTDWQNFQKFWAGHLDTQYVWMQETKDTAANYRTLAQKYAAKHLDSDTSQFQMFHVFKELYVDTNPLSKATLKRQRQKKEITDKLYDTMTTKYPFAYNDQTGQIEEQPRYKNDMELLVKQQQAKRKEEKEKVDYLLEKIYKDGQKEFNLKLTPAEMKAVKRNMRKLKISLTDAENAILQEVKGQQPSAQTIVERSQNNSHVHVSQRPAGVSRLNVEDINNNQSQNEHSYGDEGETIWSYRAHRTRHKNRRASAAEQERQLQEQRGDY